MTNCGSCTHCYLRDNYARVFGQWALKEHYQQHQDIEHCVRPVKHDEADCEDCIYRKKIRQSDVKEHAQKEHNEDKYRWLLRISGVPSAFCDFRCSDLERLFE